MQGCDIEGKVVELSSLFSEGFSCIGKGLRFRLFLRVAKSGRALSILCILGSTIGYTME